MAADAEADVCCANCGIAGVDDIKLEECNDCDLVKYCGGKCREQHREQHDEECKNRKALLHDRKLFTQPDGSYLGECPICFLPLPIDPQKSMLKSCCSNNICKGCVYANMVSNKDDSVKAGACPFCREPASSDEEHRKRSKKRIKANDPLALRQMGAELYRDGDYDGAFEYLTKAAEFGDVGAHYMLGNIYWRGQGVEKDDKKELYHWEMAAMGGHPYARYKLGCYEEAMNGDIERAVKHFIIAANLGMEGSMKALWKHYSLGNITKEDLDATLRTHQGAIDATKSEQRDAGEELFDRLGM